MDTEVEYEPPPPLVRRVAVISTVVATVFLAFALMTRVGGAMEERAEIEEARTAAAAEAGTAPSVRVVRPEATTHADEVVLTGTLEPIQSANLAFEVPGRVARVDVVLGQEVEEGDVLATLDRSGVGAASAQSSAAISVAEANAEMARDRVRTLEPLVRARSIAERDLTTARQQLAIAEAQLQQARASRRQVAASQADHILRAPFDGVVTQVPAGVGAAANPGMPLFRVEDLSSLRLRTTVSQQELEHLRRGMTVSLDGLQAEGELQTLVRSLDTQTRRAPVEVRVPNEEGALVANAFIRARITVGEARPMFRLPASAGRSDDTVLVVVEGKLEARPIHSRIDEHGDLLVLEGVSAEDLIVERAAGMHVDEEVTPNEVEAE